MEGFEEAEVIIKKWLAALEESKRLMNECMKNLDINRVYMEEVYFWKNYKLGG